MRAAALGVAIVVATSGLTLAVPATSYAAITGTDCTATDGDPSDPVIPATGPSLPLEEMQIPRVQAAMTPAGSSAEPGAGTTVAVIDSGVSTSAPIDVTARMSFGGARSTPVYAHGTIVAGLIAGKPLADGDPVGIAPGARIVDLATYDAEVADKENKLTGVAPGPVLEALQWVLRNHRSYDISIVNVSLAFDREDGATIARTIAALWKQDVIVVASTGNRPSEAGQYGYPKYLTPSASEDAVRDFLPAGYPFVVGANATALGVPLTSDTGESGSSTSPAPSPTTYVPLDPTMYVLQNSATDIAVPTYGAVSYSRAGVPCSLSSVATSWSAAEVSGILALLHSAFPRETAPQLVARLTYTADGRGGLQPADVQPSDPTFPDLSLLTGYGVAQPYEALTRSLTMTKGGKVLQSQPATDTTVVTAPEPVVDPLGNTRRNAVWWALIGGGALVLALVLRPVLARRRPTPRMR